jgi:hypothetical protein
MVEGAAPAELSSRDAPSAGSGSAPERPLAAYAVLAGTYLAGLSCALAFAGSRVPRPTGGDIVLFGIATGALSRLVTRDAVSAPFRAPFTEYEGPAGAGEVHERPRGTGLQRAIGELVTCPFCMAPWAATAIFVVATRRPRTARLVASILAGVMVSNVVNQAYAFLRKRA